MYAYVYIPFRRTVPEMPTEMMAKRLCYCIKSASDRWVVFFKMIVCTIRFR